MLTFKVSLFFYMLGKFSVLVYKNGDCKGRGALAVKGVLSEKYVSSFCAVGRHRSP